MTLTHTPSVYPGMIDKGIEFFAVEGKMKFIADSKIQCTTNLPFGIIQLAKEQINTEPEVAAALKEWHPTSEFNQVNQFLKCRYGGLDFSADFIDNQFKSGDYWDCPSRGSCPFNGTLCKAPVYNGHELSALEIKLMKLTASSLTNETIALDLKIPFGSFHKHKQALYEKLAVQTKQEVALIAKSLNLI